MFVDARSVPRKASLETDVCIIGAGAAGITLAREFRGAPFRVCLLESGGVTPDAKTQALAQGHNVGLPYRRLDSARSRSFGGTTDQWAGTCLPLDDIDFESRPWMPYSGWPFTRAELEPYYRRAQVVCEVGPFTYRLDAWVDSSGPGHLPWVGDRVATSIVQFSPPTRFGRAYRRDVAGAPNITTLLYANAVELETDAQARRVTRVQVACLDGNTFSVAPKVVILAAGGIENPRLLLLSSGVAPGGLGNDHDLVGRFFMEHPHVEAGIVVPTHPYIPSRLYKKCRVSGTVIMGILTLSAEVRRREQLLNYSALLIPEEVSAGVESLKRLYRALRARAWSAELWRDMRGAVGGTSIQDVAQAAYGTFVKRQLPLQRFRVLSRTEQAPNPASRLTLGSDVDALGQRRVRLDWRLSPIDKRSIRRALEIIGQELRRAGLGDLQGGLDDDDTSWALPPGSGGHHMGTTRMHPDPRQGVVDSRCQVHGLTNLFIAGSSVFPTGGHANPTLTIVALALRLAEHVKQRMREPLDNLGDLPTFRDREASAARGVAKRVDSTPRSRRLLYVGTLPPHPGGSALSGFQLLTGLTRAGHTVRSLAPITPEADWAGDHFAASQPELGVVRFPVPYFETEASRHMRAGMEYRLLEQKQIEERFSGLIEAERPDIVLLGRETFAWRIPHLAKRLDLPCILRIAGTFLTQIVDGTCPPPVAAQWLEGARKVDVIVGQTTSIAGSLAALGLHRTRIIPNGVDLDLFSPERNDHALRSELGVAHDHVVVVHASNLKPLKRPLDIVHSAARALRVDPRLVYVVVGDGPLRQSMEDTCRDHGILEHFRFVGWVEYSRMAAYLTLADLVVMPSESEAQSRVYLETQACARTLLASDIPGARHVVEHGETGLLFRAGDVDDLTAKTLWATADASRRAHIGARARQRVMAHSLDRVAAAYTELIEEVIEERGRVRAMGNVGGTRSKFVPPSFQAPAPR